MKKIKHTLVKAIGLIERGFCDFHIADRLLEDGSEDLFNAYISDCEQKEIDHIRREITESDAKIGAYLRSINAGEKIVNDICSSVVGKEAAKDRLMQAKVFFSDYGLTEQANRAWKAYWHETNN